MSLTIVRGPGYFSCVFDPHLFPLRPSSSSPNLHPFGLLFVANLPWTAEAGCGHRVTMPASDSDQPLDSLSSVLSGRAAW